MPSYDTEGFCTPAPVARVTIHTQGGENSIDGVPMLIDSGADVSLIPRSCAQQLGLEAQEEKNYKLRAFDGSQSIARSVRCEVIFLQKSYRGIYLVLDGPVGILGRDVLNRVCLMLNGPRLTWREGPMGA